MNEGIKEQAKNSLQKQPVNMVGMKTNQVKDLIMLYKDQISAALPKHLTAERMIQISTSIISRSPELAECTIPSLMGAVIQASMLGFEPISALGQCHLIPFKNSKNGGQKEVQFLIGYKGLLQLARRSGEIQTAYAKAVYSKDQFTYEFGLEPKLVHVPTTSTDKGDLTAVYAVIKYKSGGYDFEVMNKADIEKLRKRAQSQQSWDDKAKCFKPHAEPKFIWATDYESMAKKTVLKQALKYAPLSTEYASQVVTDGAVLKADDFNQGSLDLSKIENADAVIQDDIFHEAEAK